MVSSAGVINRRKTPLPVSMLLASTVYVPHSPTDRSSLSYICEDCRDYI